MSDVKRYRLHDSVADGETLRITGCVVLASDYDALAQRCRELEVLLHGTSESYALRCDELQKIRLERDTLRAKVERLRKDSARLQWLADNMRLMSGHKATGHYQLPELVEWVESAREGCTLDDLRAALDAMPEAI